MAYYSIGSISEDKIKQLNSYGGDNLKVARFNVLLVSLIAAIFIFSTPTMAADDANVVNRPADVNSGAVEADSSAQVGFAPGKLDLRVPNPENVGFPNFGTQYVFTKSIWKYRPAVQTGQTEAKPVLDNTIIVTDTRGAESGGWNLSVSCSKFHNTDTSVAPDEQVQPISSLDFTSAKIVQANVDESNNFSLAQDFDSSSSGITGLNTLTGSQNYPWVYPSDDINDPNTTTTLFTAQKGTGLGYWGLFLTGAQLVTPSQNGQVAGNFKATLTWTLNGGNPTTQA